ncbi:MAG TPA: adenylyltransferase/cytidyltransferase family protein [Ktedonobacterales bacterium]|jgi:rfaE bifunctional protein nucleotidyltransferase chain/domain
MGVVLDEPALRDEIARRKAEGARVIFTNGVFDLLHLGHVRYLREARDLGDLLIVGVNSDASTRRLKGPTRPIIAEDDRAETLAALGAVDYVTIFADATAERLVRLLRPDIYVKGADYVSGAPTSREQTLLLAPEELRRIVADQPTDHAGLAGLAERLPEARAVAEYGGSLALIAYLPSHSTSELIVRIVRSAQQEPE